MKVTYEFNLREFKAWSGAVETLNKIESFDIEHPGAMDKAQEYIEEGLGDEATETQINDMLWFEDDAILDYIGYYEEPSEDEEDENGFEEEEF